jgi:arylsulfatase A-like enzyme
MWIPKNIRQFFNIIGISLFISPLSCPGQVQTKPNIVIIITDDQGYADISFNPLHPPEVNTPNMDSLAREGIFFSQAYISGNVCSPTRAGLMTGRYQQRSGIYTAGEGGSGLPLDEKIFPQYLKPAGYVCGAFGKWHLGLTPEYNPVSRGFDEFYGFMGRGAHDYFDLDDPDSPIYRGLNPISDSGYLTNRLTEEAITFIKNHKEEPFFVYLAYNAVHYPAQAPPEDVALYNTGDPLRDTLMAMLKHLDEGVGDVVKTLKNEGLWENTLLFFLTDNGGAAAMHAINTPLRDFKSSNYEGGIRTPFILSWPAKYQGGHTVHTPVMSLDILPTVMAAAGVEEPLNKPFDGKNIQPILEQAGILHDKLYWSEGGESGTWAVRSGKWKLVVHKDLFELFDLENDPSETTDLSEIYPDTVLEMSISYDTWLDEMAEPIQLSGKRWIPEIAANQLVTLYSDIYFKGNYQSFDKTGIFNTTSLSYIGNNQTSSLLLAKGYDVMIFTGDSLQGEEKQVASSLSSMGKFDNQLSSMVIYPESNLEMRNMIITASTASSTAHLVTDGDLETYWDATGNGVWIQFSLCKTMKLDGINIAFRRGNKRIAYFDVEASTDGSAWFSLLGGAQSNGIQVAPEYFDLPDLDARYVRITGFGNSDNSQNHYTEVELVYGINSFDGIHIEAENFITESNVTKFISDDCTSLLAINAKQDGAWAEYSVSLSVSGSYLFDIRMKVLQSGTVFIRHDDSIIKSIGFDASDVGNEWKTLSEFISLPQGEQNLILGFRSDYSGDLFHINWFELSPASATDTRMKFNPFTVNIFPVPFGEELNLVSSLVMERVLITDCYGRTVLQEEIKDDHCILNTSKLMSGMYIIRIGNRQDFCNRNIIKIK